jgi:hypothetical protein
MSVRHLRPAPGWAFTGYSEVAAFEAADGSIWWSAALKRPSDGAFRVVVMRQAPNAPHSEIIPTQVEGFRGGINMAPEGLRLAVFHIEENRVETELIPGFAPRGGAMQAPAPGTTPVSGADDVARGMAQQALEQAGFAVERSNFAKDLAAGAAAQAAAAEQSAASKLDRQAAEEIAWAKAGDRFADIWNRMVRYEMPQLLNLIHNRVRRFVIAQHVARIEPGGTAAAMLEADLPANRDETLFM